MNEYQRILSDLKASKHKAWQEGDGLKLAYLNDIQL
jgi:hypothetical protein